MPQALSEIPVVRPDAAAFQARAHARIAAWSAATTDDRVSLVRDWNADRERYATAKSLADIRFTQDTRESQHVADKEFFDELAPTVKELDVAFLRLVVEATDRPELAAALGPHVLAVWEQRLAGFDPAMKDVLREESRLTNTYDGLMSELRGEVDGRSVTMPEIGAMLGDADRSVREKAAVALDAALGEVGSQLDGIYDELVGLRHRMGRILGEESFTPVGYRLLERTDYTAAEVDRFRAEILEHIVPLAGKIMARRAGALGIDRMMYWDEAVADPRGVPRPLQEGTWILDRANELFERLGEDFSVFWAGLRSREMIDTESRDGKVPGGYCVGLDAEASPFIFANFNGTQSDVEVVTHEAGHAFQWWSSKDIELRDLRWPTLEACEIHSMGLELLTYPHMELFFGDDADRFRAQHLAGCILFLPYGALVDEFQHRVYAEPERTPAERLALWRELERKWIPYRDYTGLDHLEAGRRWQRQGHIFSAPFYYIDYCLAQTCALQLWQASLEDPEGTWSRYRQLCKLGGSQPFTQLVAAVGLKNPFAPGCLSDVAVAVAEALDLS